MLVANTGTIMPDFAKGYTYLGVFALVVVAFAASVFWLKQKKS
jgi:hypothetical protein